MAEDIVESAAGEEFQFVIPITGYTLRSITPESTDNEYNLPPGEWMFVEGWASDASEDKLKGRMTERAIIGMVNCVNNGSYAPVFHSVEKARKATPTVGVDVDHSMHWTDQIGYVVKAEAVYNIPPEMLARGAKAPAMHTVEAIDLEMSHGRDLKRALDKGTQLGKSIYGKVVEGKRQVGRSGELVSETFDLVDLHKIAITSAPVNNVTFVRAIKRSMSGAELEEESIDSYLERYLSQKERDSIADEDFAGPNRTFPIDTQAHLDAAARLIGHAADPAAVKRKAIAIAKRKGLKLPESWESASDEPDGDSDDKGRSMPDPDTQEENIVKRAEETTELEAAEASNSGEAQAGTTPLEGVEQPESASSDAETSVDEAADPVQEEGQPENVERAVATDAAQGAAEPVVEADASTESAEGSETQGPSQDDVARALGVLEQHFVGEERFRAFESAVKELLSKAAEAPTLVSKAMAEVDTLKATVSEQANTIATQQSVIEKLVERMDKYGKQGQGRFGVVARSFTEEYKEEPAVDFTPEERRSIARNLASQGEIGAAASVIMGWVKKSEAEKFMLDPTKVLPPPVQEGEQK